jgi:hypothetical protein
VIFSLNFKNIDIQKKGNNNQKVIGMVGVAKQRTKDVPTELAVA